MSSAEIWVTIILLTLATIITRCAFFVFGHNVKLPEKVQRALRYAPAAAMAAIVAPDLVLAQGEFVMDWANPKLLAAIAATVFFLKTRHMLGTLAVGMVVFTVLRLAH